MKGKRTAVFRSLKNRALVCLGVLTVLSGVPAAAQDTALQDTALSRAYTRIAGGLDAKNFQAANELLQAAVEFDPSNSDPKYLQARIIIDHEESVSLRTAVELLETAIQQNSWHTESPDAAKLALAALYDRLMRYRDQYTLLMTIPPDRRVVPEWYYYAARGASLQGNGTEALSLVREGTRRFPSRDDLRLLRISLDAGFRSYLADVALDLRQKPLPGPVLGALIKSVDGDLQEKLYKRYRDLGFADPDVMITLEKGGEGKSGVELADLLSEDALGAKESFVQLASLFASRDRGDEFEAYLKSATFDLSEDRNRDGYVDSVYRFRRGRIEDFRRDRDQDRVDDIHVQFTEAAEPWSPQHLTTHQAGNTVDISYRGYPEVAALSLHGDGNSTMFDFAPGVFSYDVLASTDRPPLVSLKDEALPAVSDLETLAYKTRMRKDDTGSVLPAGNTQGTVVHTSILPQSNTDQNERRVERDINGDGIPEILEVYRGGKLESVSLDQEENGIFEYRIDLTEGIESWDWDQDGKVDYRYRIRK